MTPAHNRRPRTALAVVACKLAGMTVLASLGPGDPSFQRDPAGFIGFICAFGAFGIVGALIIWQRPGNTLGWVLAAVGLGRLGGFRRRLCRPGQRREPALCAVGVDKPLVLVPSARSDPDLHAAPVP